MYEEGEGYNQDYNTGGQGGVGEGGGGGWESAAQFLPALGNMVGNLFGGNKQPSYPMTVNAGWQQNVAADMSAQNQKMDTTQFNALMQMMKQGQQPLDGALSQGAIASGQIGQAAQARNYQSAFGGMGQASQEAMRMVDAQMQSRGLGNSSISGSAFGSMMAPMMAQANQQYAQLQMAEVNRLQDLRQREMNMNMQMSTSAMPYLSMLQNMRQFESQQYAMSDTTKKGKQSQYEMNQNLENAMPITRGV